MAYFRIADNPGITMIRLGVTGEQVTKPHPFRPAYRLQSRKEFGVVRGAILYGRFTIFVVLLADLLAVSLAGQTPSLQVLVLDALNGKPQANVKVEYFCARPQHNSAHQWGQTNGDGLLKFSNPCSEEEDIEIATYPPDHKEQCGVGPITLKTILTDGAVAQPDADGGISCPTKISKKLKPVPGQVIMFVKKPTWWQSHVAG